MLYGSYSSGFRSGGYNPLEVLNIGIKKEIEPEYSKGIELGLKTSFAKNRIIFNAAYFSTAYKNQQIYRFTSEGGRSTLGTINYEESKIAGFDADAKIRVTKNFDLTGGFSSIKTEITKAFDKTSIGNKIPFAPQSSYNIGLFSHFKVKDNARISTNINVENKGKKYWFADDLYGVDQEKIFQKPYTLVNAKINLELTKTGLTVGIWGKNIFNTQYNVEWWGFSAFNQFFPDSKDQFGDIRTPSTPATFGIELGYQF